MRLFKFLVLLIGCVFCFYGCQESTVCKNPDEVKIKGGGLFPKFLVGTWQAEDENWALTFAKNGTITKVLHYFAYQPLDMSKKKIEEGKKEGSGAYSLYEMGDYQVIYDPQTRNLDVTIAIDGYYTRMPIGEFTGRCLDRFTGQISKDGKRWDTNWFSYLEIIDLEEPDLNNIEPKALTFKKVSAR